MNKEIKEMVADVEMKKTQAALHIQEKMWEAYLYILNSVHIKTIIESVDWEDMNS